MGTSEARFYDPQLGRFLTEDPVFGDLTDPPSLHWYTYGKVNPTVWVDPDGRMSQEQLDELLVGAQEKLDTAQEAVALADETLISAAADLSDQASEKIPVVGGFIGNRIEDAAAAGSAVLGVIGFGLHGADQAIDHERLLSSSSTIADRELRPRQREVLEKIERETPDVKEIIENVVDVGTRAVEGDADAQIRAKRTALEFAAGGKGAGSLRGASRAARTRSAGSGAPRVNLASPRGKARSGGTAGRITGDLAERSRRVRMAKRGDTSAVAELKVAELLRLEGKDVRFVPEAQTPRPDLHVSRKGKPLNQFTEVKRAKGLKNLARDLNKGVGQVGEGGLVIVVRAADSRVPLATFEGFVSRFNPKDPSVSIRVVDEASLPNPKDF